MEGIEFQLNGKNARLEVEGERKLFRVLLPDLNHPGTQYGYGQGLAGLAPFSMTERASIHARCRFERFGGEVNGL